MGNNLKYTIRERSIMRIETDILSKKKNIPIYSIRGEPKQHESFDLLKDSIWVMMNGNCLKIRKDGSLMNLYIHEAFDIIYLSRYPTKPNEQVWGIDERKEKNPVPFEEFLENGREGKITHVEKEYWTREDKEKDLLKTVTISAENCPYSYRLRGDDGVIFVTVKPSMNYTIGRIHEITKKNLNNLTKKEIQELKSLEYKIPIPIFNEDLLKKEYPDFYSELRR